MKMLMPVMAALLAGCAASPEIISSSEDNVVIYAPPSVAQEASQVLADKECAKFNKTARLVREPDANSPWAASYFFCIGPRENSAEIKNEKSD